MGNAVVYRPAYDAEVEYLESTGTQWIDTGVYPNSATSFELKETLTVGRFMFGCWDGDVDNAVAYIITGEASATGILFYRNAGTTNNMVLNYDCGGLHIYSFRNKKLYVDNVEIGDLPVQTDTERLQHSIYLFNRNANGGPTLEQSTNSRIHSFQVTEDGVLVRDFIPVRIGSVGYMYDKVSKKLFSNAGTGNFILGNDVVNATIPQQRCVLYFGSQRSVGFERIYEEYEWLKGDGMAYIDTLEHYRPYSDSFDLIAKDNKYPNRVFQNDEWIFGLYETINSNILRVGAYIPAALRMSINIVYYSTTPPVWIDYCVNTGVNSNAIHNIHINKVVNDKYSFDYNGDTFSDKVTVQEFPNNFESQGTLALFNNFGYNVVPFNGAVSKYVHYRDSEVKYDLIPCKLLQSIPAILDGNGIARQAGECGMWDKVSGRFFGNVASSGTFTVSND